MRGVRASTNKALAVAAVLALIIGGTIGAAHLLLRPSAAGVEGWGPELEYYPTDLAGVLSDSDLYNIDGVCDIVNENTSCEMEVVVVSTTEPYDIDYYALHTFQLNQIGKEGRDNGLLVVVATEDQAWRIEIGYGLEGNLPDVRVNDLAQEHLVPNMEHGSYGDGLFDPTYALEAILETEYVGDRSPDKVHPILLIHLTWGEIGWIAVGYIVLVVLTKGWALRPLLLLLSLLGGGRFGFRAVVQVG